MMAVLVGLGAGRVWADDVGLSDTTRASIVQGCDNIKLRIKQLQSNDASTRVTLGQNYESMLTKLMDAMNARLTANRIDGGELPTIAASFSKNLGYFRKNYTSYDQNVDDLQKIDCAQQPKEFYKQLVKTRELRDEVRYNYTKLNELIESYRVEFDRVWQERSNA
jgi:hypothetical protein